MVERRPCLPQVWSSDKRLRRCAAIISFVSEEAAEHTASSPFICILLGWKANILPAPTPSPPLLCCGMCLDVFSCVCVLVKWEVNTGAAGLCLAPFFPATLSVQSQDNGGETSVQTETRRHVFVWMWEKTCNVLHETSLWVSVVNRLARCLEVNEWKVAEERSD